MLLKYLNSDILNYIIQNNLQPSDRLPSLTQLSQLLEISVGKLREQLEVARSLNLVSVKPKAGIQVNNYNFAAAIKPGLLYAMAQAEDNFTAYKSLRNVAVAGFWVEATTQLTETDIAGLRALLDMAQTKLSSQRISIPHAEHRTFHLNLLQHLDNPFVIGIEEAYWDAYEAVELNNFIDYQYLKDVWVYHERMVNFIEKKQFDNAKETFIEHTCLLKHRVSTAKNNTV